VVEVSWYGALAFATWAGATLPTEAQWEYACRSGAKSTWAGTDDESDLASYANLAGDSDGLGGLGPVGNHRSSPWGLQDLTGGVSEWTASEYSPTLSADTAATPVAPSSGASRAVRGGSWRSSPTTARCASRYREKPFKERWVMGFRVALPSTPSGTGSETIDP